MPREPHHRAAAVSASKPSRPIPNRAISDQNYDEAGDLDASITAVKGRPRKTVQDAEAVERRRTQLRVAQRAFRRRRETTIDELREQVGRLQDANEDLLDSMRGFAERAVAKGLSDELAIDLCAILKHHSSRHDAEVAASVASHSDEELKRPATIRRKSSTRSRLVEPMDVANQHSTREAGETHAATVPEQASGLDHASHPPVHHDHISVLRTSQTQSAPPDLVRDLIPSTTIGFDETSFSGRIRRRALEVGYQIVANRSRAPQAYQRVFKWPISEGNDDMSILLHMQDKLSRGPEELLVTDRPNLNWSAIDQADLDKLPGLNESWFFPKDVEAYLHYLRIDIPPGVWYVNAKVKRDTLRSKDSSDTPNMIATAVHNMQTEPFYASLCEKYGQLVGENFLYSLMAPATTATTNPTSSPSPIDNTFSEFSQQYAMPAFAGVIADPFIQLNNMAWASSGSAVNVATKPITYSSNPSILPLHEGAIYDQPDDLLYDQRQNAEAQASSEYLTSPRLDGDFDLQSSLPLSYSGTLDAVSTAAQATEEPLVDVTLDITQLMYNLLLAVSCLGGSQGYRKTDIDRALRASIMLHT